jgi:uncharacterized protein
MAIHDWFLVGAAVFSETLGVLSGFGSSTFFLPIASIFESFHLVLVLTAILHCFANTSKLFLFRDYLKLNLMIRFVLPSLILAGVGAWLNPLFSIQNIELALGIFLVLLSSAKLFWPAKVQIPKTWAPALSAFSGLLTGLIGTGGAIRGVALSALGVSKNSFVALSTAIDVGGDFLRAGIYLKNGYMDWAQWYYVPLLAVAALAGATLGKKLLKRINQAQFEKIVSIFIFVSGVLLVLGI